MAPIRDVDYTYPSKALNPYYLLVLERLGGHNGGTNSIPLELIIFKNEKF